MKNLERDLEKEEESNKNRLEFNSEERERRLRKKRMITRGTIGCIGGIGAYLLASYFSSYISGMDFDILQVPYKDWITSSTLFGSLGVFSGFDDNTYD